MKRGRVALLIVAGVLVFALVLLAYLPASWVAARVPPGLQAGCGEIGGSVWAGECLGVTLQGAKLGDVTWNLDRLGALRGRLVGDFDLRGALNARADVDLSFSGSGELREVKASLPLDPRVMPQLPPDQRGRIAADLKRLVLDERAPRVLEGTIDLTDLRQVGARPLELGSYRATFDGQADANGISVGQIRDLGGPFALEGTITLTPPNTYVVQGFITGRTVEAERLVREITLGATPEASGRSPFAFEGTY
jgi:hypothetical protein